MLKIYLLEDIRTEQHWDWNGSIVLAESEEQALVMGDGRINIRDKISVTEIGIAGPNMEKGVILESWSG